MRSSLFANLHGDGFFAIAMIEGKTAQDAHFRAEAPRALVFCPDVSRVWGTFIDDGVSTEGDFVYMHPFTASGESERKQWKEEWQQVLHGRMGILYDLVSWLHSKVLNS